MTSTQDVETRIRAMPQAERDQLSLDYLGCVHKDGFSVDDLVAKFLDLEIEKPVKWARLKRELGVPSDQARQMRATRVNLIVGVIGAVAGVVAAVSGVSTVCQPDREYTPVRRPASATAPAADSASGTPSAYGSAQKNGPVSTSCRGNAVRGGFENRKSMIRTALTHASTACLKYARILSRTADSAFLSHNQIASCSLA